MRTLVLHISTHFSLFSVTSRRRAYPKERAQARVMGFSLPDVAPGAERSNCASGSEASFKHRCLVDGVTQVLQKGQNQTFRIRWDESRRMDHGVTSRRRDALSHHNGR
jgi:hypothetical protein